MWKATDPISLGAQSFKNFKNFAQDPSWDTFNEGRDDIHHRWQDAFKQNKEAIAAYLGGAYFGGGSSAGSSGGSQAFGLGGDTAAEAGGSSELPEIVVTGSRTGAGPATASVAGGGGVTLDSSLNGKGGGFDWQSMMKRVGGNMQQQSQQNNYQAPKRSLQVDPQTSLEFMQNDVSPAASPQPLYETADQRRRRLIAEALKYG
jgi:hypothetical protein